MNLNLSELQLTKDDIDVIKMCLYREAMNNFSATRKFGDAGKVFDKLYPVTGEKLRG